MGWDGKPIPYWLYKLHGLGQVISPTSTNFICDVKFSMCSNFVNLQKTK